MKISKSLLVLLLITALTGCASLRGNKGGPSTAQKKKMEAIQKLANNIPLYPKFKYIPDKSFFFESNGVKAGVMVFEGKGRVGDLVKFYQREMPLQGWSMVSSYQYGKEALLDFSAPDKTCQISIEEQPFKTVLVIRTGTRAPEGYAK